MLLPHYFFTPFILVLSRRGVEKGLQEGAIDKS
jgi:hypothetical protein